jgi:hypothetical protein
MILFIRLDYRQKKIHDKALPEDLMELSGKQVRCAVSA